MRHKGNYWNQIPWVALPAAAESQWEGEKKPAFRKGSAGNVRNAEGLILHLVCVYKSKPLDLKYFLYCSSQFISSPKLM